MVVLDHTWLNLDWLVMVLTAIRYHNYVLNPLFSLNYVFLLSYSIPFLMC